MYDVIARTACLILTGICLAGFLLGKAFSSGLPIHQALSGRSSLRPLALLRGGGVLLNAGDRMGFAAPSGSVAGQHSCGAIGTAT